MPFGPFEAAVVVLVMLGVTLLVLGALPSRWEARHRIGDHRSLPPVVAGPEDDEEIDWPTKDEDDEPAGSIRQTDGTRGSLETTLIMPRCGQITGLHHFADTAAR